MCEDLDLVKRARKGEREAFDELFQRHCDPLIAFAFRITRDRSDAEDLVQDAFLAALNGLTGYKGKSTFFTWLCGVVIRRHRDLRRRPHLVGIAESVEKPPEVPEASQAIETLGRKHREAFLLVKIVGLTYEEAGKVLRKPAGTVKWLCSEATARLRTLLSEDAYDAK